MINKRCPNCHSITGILIINTNVECLDCDYPKHNKTKMRFVDTCLITEDTNNLNGEIAEYEN